MIPSVNPNIIISSKMISLYFMTTLNSVQGSHHIGIVILNDTPTLFYHGFLPFPYCWLVSTFPASKDAYDFVASINLFGSPSIDSNSPGLESLRPCPFFSVSTC